MLIRGFRSLVQVLYLTHLYDVVRLARLAAQTFIGWIHYHSWLDRSRLALLRIRLLNLG